MRQTMRDWQPGHLATVNPIEPKKAGERRPAAKTKQAKKKKEGPHMAQHKKPAGSSSGKHHGKKKPKKTTTTTTTTRTTTKKNPDEMPRKPLLGQIKRAAWGGGIAAAAILAVGALGQNVLPQNLRDTKPGAVLVGGLGLGLGAAGAYFGAPDSITQPLMAGGIAAGLLGVWAEPVLAYTDIRALMASRQAALPAPAGTAGEETRRLTLTARQGTAGQETRRLTMNAGTAGVGRQNVRGGRFSVYAG